MTIARSRKQRVFVKKETTIGTMVFPAGTDFIFPAGDAIINQVPAFTNSEEKRDTLDVIEQFQDAKPPGTWTIPMYVRPSGTLGTAPQGDVLFELLMGAKNDATTAALNGAVADGSVGTIHIDTIAGGTIPEHGVFQVGAEYIYYGGKVQTAGSASATLTDVTRGYNSSTGSGHSDDLAMTLKSVFYKQDTESPSASIWIETDHFIQGLSGCTVNNATINYSNKGGVLITLSGEGMEMVWAGTTAMAANATAGVSGISVDNAKLFSEGAYIQNETQGHNNSTSGYLITAVNVSTNRLTLGTALEGNWATDDVIRGYLPAETTTGTALEARKTDAYVDGIETRLTSADLTFNVPKVYVDDEVGIDYPEEYIEDQRSISGPFVTKFRETDAQYFYDGYEDNEVTLGFIFGDTVGSIMEIYMKKCQLDVPTIQFAAPAVELSMTFNALGTVGEDSAEICFY